jgi:transcriptional regulator with XRE-family HTH domain
MKIIDRIEAARIEREITSDALEKMAGLSAGRLCRWRKVGCDPRVSELMRIARALEVPVQALLPEELGRHDAPRRVPTAAEREAVYAALGKLVVDDALTRLIGPDLEALRRDAG